MSRLVETDLSTLLTEDVIEAAARAMQECGQSHGVWENIALMTRNYWRRRARAALSAALPMIVERLQKQ
jgi:hypothetical protein